MRTIVTVPATREGKILAQALGRLAVLRPVACEGDNYGHVEGDHAAQIVRALRVSFSEITWNIAPSK